MPGQWAAWRQSSSCSLPSRQHRPHLRRNTRLPAATTQRGNGRSSRRRGCAAHALLLLARDNNTRELSALNAPDYALAAWRRARAPGRPRRGQAVPPRQSESPPQGWPRSEPSEPRAPRRARRPGARAARRSAHPARLLVAQVACVRSVQSAARLSAGAAAFRRLITAATHNFQYKRNPFGSTPRPAQLVAAARTRTSTAARAACQSPRVARPAAPRAARRRGPGSPGTRGRRTRAGRRGESPPAPRTARRRPPPRQRPPRRTGRTA